MLDRIEHTLDKCIHNHELMELLREQIASCTDEDKLKELRESLAAHLMSNEAMLQAATFRIRKEPAFPVELLEWCNAFVDRLNADGVTPDSVDWDSEIKVASAPVAISFTWTVSFAGCSVWFGCSDGSWEVEMFWDDRWSHEYSVLNG